MMDETLFRTQLAALVKRYTQAHETGKGEREWEIAWHELLLDASRDQARRAEALLTLHIGNQSIDEWVCRECTAINTARRTHCARCGARRS